MKRLTDEALADLLAKSGQEWDDAGMPVDAATVASLVREVQRVRADVARQRGVIDENNALRKNNERLRRRIADADDVEAVLRQALDDARKSASTAQTMAAHWKLKTNGGQ